MSTNEKHDDAEKHLQEHLAEGQDALVEDMRIFYLRQALDNCLLALEDARMLEARLPILKYDQTWRNFDHMVAYTIGNSRAILRTLDARTDESEQTP